MTLYYSDTERNRASGKIPDSIVELPSLDWFEPNNNKNPQVSDASGAYGFMVFPYSDYYIVATKEGYNKYTSPTIHVENDIVKFDIGMTPIDKEPGAKIVPSVDDEKVQKDLDTNDITRVTGEHETNNSTTNAAIDKHQSNSNLPATATNNYNILCIGIFMFLASLSLLLVSKKHKN